MEDERGFFARVYCEHEFQKRGLHAHWVQSNLSFNHRAGTLRGMHYQAAPDEEVKLVTCTAGSAHYVALDLRPQSATHLQWIGIDLSADNRLSLYVPAGVALGFLTLMDNTQLLYHMGSFYVPASQRGARWNDPAFGIQWPAEITLISERDQAFPDYQQE